jgi:Flp pilus assembly protein TadD
VSAPTIARALRIAFALGLAAGLASCSHLVLLHDPLTANEHNDLGFAYESSGELELAAREYRKALRLDPHQARTRVNLGNVEGATGRWAAAEKHYRRALRDSTTDYDAMNNLAFALLQRGRRLDEARALAERAVAAGGERDSIYRATLAQVERGMRTGRTDSLGTRGQHRQREVP